MKILVFLQGTLTMGKSGLGKTRQERVQQSLVREDSYIEPSNYIPIDNAVEKLKEWKSQGAEIFYLSSNKNQAEIAKDQAVLEKYNFPSFPIVYRQNNESYAEVAEKLMPDILVEDDCESIGGENEMTYPHIKPELKSKIKSIVIKEFAGIDHLPDNIKQLF